MTHWQTELGVTSFVTKLCTILLAQESVQEIFPYIASGHVMEIHNYPAQGLVQDLWSFLHVPVLVQERVQRIVPYTVSGHVMISSYRCQACVGNLI